MDYEKKDVLETLRRLVDKSKKQGHVIIRIEDIEAAFPELEESEDEKIRKWLIAWANAANWSEQFSITKEQVLTWLEKQGEQKHTEMKTMKDAGYEWNAEKKQLKN